MGLTKSKNYEFITLLRGFAAVSVVIAHLVMMYYSGGASAAFPFMLPVNHAEPQLLAALNRLAWQLKFNFGPFGVSIFFLISGFLISNSLKNKTAIEFIKKRIFRVYPVYIIGFSCTFLLIFLYTRFISHVEFPYGLKDWLLQISLLRDWFWVTSIDGVSWTLETDLKFYVFAIALLHMNLQHNKKGIIWITVGLCLVSVLAAKAQLVPGLTIEGVSICYGISFGCCAIIYMCLGLCIFNWFSQRWTAKESIIIGIIVYVLFVLSAKYSVWSSLNSTIPNYTYSLILFVIVVKFADRMPRMPILRFISKISFSLYIIHGLNGYMIISVLDHWGINPYVCILLSIFLTTILAYVLYKVVEEPLAKCKNAAVGKAINQD